MTANRSGDNASLTCQRCGWPESDPYEIVSRHYTSAGVIEYTRCACGLLQVRYRNAADAADSGRMMARGARPAVRRDRGAAPDTAA